MLPNWTPRLPTRHRTRLQVRSRLHSAVLHSPAARLTLGLFAAVLLGAGAGVPAPVHGQTGGLADVSGTVVDGFDDPVVGAIVTVYRFGEWTGLETTSDQQGRFSLPGVAPGTLDIRVEALGYHPVVVQGVSLRPGQLASLSVRLREGRPPIVETDTVPAGSGSLDLDRWLEGLEEDAISDTRLLSERLTLASTVDREGGALGLPSRFTTYLVQGVPFRAATRGYGRQGMDVALSSGSMGMIRANLLGANRGPGMGAGGQVEIFNPSLAPGTTELGGAFSRDELWSARYDTPEGYRPYSFWGFGRAALDVVPDSARLVVGADYHHVERPRLPLFPGDGTLGLGSPGIENSDALTAFALLDWNFGGGNRFDLGFRAGTRPQAESLSRLGIREAASPREARDLALGAGFATTVGSASRLSFRGGFTRSQRDGGDGWALDEATPYLTDVRNGRTGGIQPENAGAAVRQGIYGSVAFAWPLMSHDLEVGLQALRSSHELDPLAGSSLWSGRGDPFSGGWQGYGSRYENTLGAQDFNATLLTLYVQDRWEPAPGLRVEAAGRLHRERLPEDALATNADWLATTGLPLDEPSSSATAFGGHLGFDWTPRGGAPVAIQGSVGATVDETDPWLLAEALALDGSATRERRLIQGGGADAWPAFPDGGSSTSSPALVLFPDSWDLPQTFFATGGMVSRFRGWQVGANAFFRRTDNLTRRTDLNRISTASGTTEAGREVWGVPGTAGRLAAEVPGSSRRFGDFDHVWFLLQDGFSETAGVTLSLERRDPGGVEVGVWYTYSSTTDNLPGLGPGQPHLSTPATVPGEDWSEGTSDLDIPHRLAAIVAVPFPLLEGGVLRSRVRLESGRAFTPGLGSGVDLNADGIFGNDPVFIPREGLDLPPRWDCLEDSRGGFVERNSCRHPFWKSLDLGVRLGLVELGGNTLSLEVDALDILNAYNLVLDEALYRVDPGTGLVADGTAQVPALEQNGGFGGTIFNREAGRMIRIGLRWGGGR